MNYTNSALEADLFKHVIINDVAIQMPLLGQWIDPIGPFNRIARLVLTFWIFTAESSTHLCRTPKSLLTTRESRRASILEMPRGTRAGSSRIGLKRSAFPLTPYRPEPC